MNTLIITSTVNVNSCLTKLVDPEIRLQQYLSSIIFYIKIKKIDSIIICDNSGYDYSNQKALRELAQTYSKKIEFLSFNNDSTKTMMFGKGYGEGEIMKFIVNNSLLYKNEDKSFFKVTGRVIVSNLEWLIKFTSPNKNYFQRISFYSLRAQDKIDTRFYHIKKDDYKKYLLNSYREVNDNKGFYLEHCFRKSIIENKMKFNFFYILPFIKGVSGSSGVSYDIPKRSFYINTFFNFILNITNIK